MNEGRKKESIRWFVEMLGDYPMRKLWHEKAEPKEETVDIFLQGMDLSREKINLFGEEEQGNRGKQFRDRNGGFQVQDFAMDFQNQKLFEESKSNDVYFGGNGENPSFAERKGQKELPEKQAMMRELFLDTKLPKERERNFFKGVVPLEENAPWQSKREDSPWFGEGVKEGNQLGFLSMEPEFQRRGEIFGKEGPLTLEMPKEEKMEQSLLFSEDNQGLGRTMEELKEAIFRMGGQQGAQNITVNISEVKETADVEEVMELLSKRLLEERNTSRRKMGEP